MKPSRRALAVAIASAVVGGGLIAAGVLSSRPATFGPVLKDVRPGNAPQSGAAAQPMDLLSVLDAGKHAVGGRWGFQERALLSPQDAYARLMAPVAPPEEYDLRLVATRRLGLGSLSLGLVLGGRQSLVVLDGWEDMDVCGLDLLDDRGARQNETTRREKLLEKNKPATIVCSVRKNGLSVTVDGRKVIDWTGAYDRLSLWHAWAVPDKRALFVGTYDTVFSIEDFTLTPLSGPASLLRA